MNTRKSIGMVVLIIATAVSGLLVVGQPPAAEATVPTVPNVAKNPLEVPPPVHAAGTVVVDLIAKEVIGQVAPGKPFWFWTFADARDGQPTVPGPMIRVKEGDTLQINLTNEANNIEPHNIDLHAVMGPGGGAAVTNIMPGETKTLTFKAMRRGAYIYHCAGGGMPWDHVSHGMYGLIQVDPPGGLARGYTEFYIGQSDWYLTDATRRDPNISDDPFYDVDQDKALAEHPNYFTFNGHTHALASPTMFGSAMRVDLTQRLTPQKVRIFFVNGGPNMGSNFHIIGQIFDKVYTGDPRDAIRNEETAYVAPGSAAVFELEAMVPGKYMLVDHALWRVRKGAAGFLSVDPQCEHPDDCLWPRNIYSPPATGSGH